MPSDDLVTRLREIAQPGTWQSVGKWDAIANEAADEIERLQKQLNLALRAYDMEIFGGSDIDENGVMRDE